MISKFVGFQIPVMYSGPYSYDAHAAEKIFARIKMRDLNPDNRSFVSRQSADTYVTWLAEQIAQIDFGNVTGLFRKMLKETEGYLLFRDI